MALTSSSSRSAVEAQLLDNCAYDVNGSVAECRLFIEAARHWQFRYLPAATTIGGNSITTNREALEAALKKAEDWLSANDTTYSTSVASGRVLHLDVSGMRD